jgi:hypothetical protein
MRKKIKTPTAQETLSMSLGPFPPSFPCRPHHHRRRRPSRSPFYPREQLLTAAVGGVGRGGVLLHRRHPPSWGFPCLPASSCCPIIPVPPRPRCLVVVWFAVVLSLLFVPCWLCRSLLALSFPSRRSPFPPHEQLLAAVEWGGGGLSSLSSLPSPSSSSSGPCPGPGWGFWCGGGGPMVPLFVILPIVAFVCRLRRCQVVQTVI